MFRTRFAAGLLAAALALGVAAQSFAQDADPLPPAIQAQLNAIAAVTATDAQFADAVANIVAANPVLADRIAAAATQVRPAAAPSIAQSLAAVVPVTQAQAVVAAIVNALPPQQRATVAPAVVNNYISAAPPTLQATLIANLAPVVAQISLPAAGQQQGNNQNNNQNNQNNRPNDANALQQTVSNQVSNPSPN